MAIILAAATAAGLLTPLCTRLAWRLNVLDRPLGEQHKQHQNATPVLGGMAMLAAWLLVVGGGLALVPGISALLHPEVVSDLVGVQRVMPRLWVIMVGAGALALMGMLDDCRQFGPAVKLSLQIVICSAVAIHPDLHITLFQQHPVVTWLLTVMWLLFIINAFNFFDNMDGLASGIAAIGAGLFMLVAGLRGQYFVGTLAAATMGTAVGFFIYNRHPASIFMGDSGSHLLGFLLAILGAQTVFYLPETNSTTSAVLIPIFILALPIFDTFAVIVIRLRAGKAIYAGDHNHISHRFERMGFQRPTAVVLVHLLALSIGLGALPLLWLSEGREFLVLLQTVGMLVFVTILHWPLVDNHDT